MTTLSWRHWTCPGCGIEAAALDGSRIQCNCGAMSWVTLTTPPISEADLENEEMWL